jgi:hypothetical protein
MGCPSIVSRGKDMAETEHGSWEQVARDNRTVYSGFLGLTKWAVILIVLVLIAMAVFLV